MSEAKQTAKLALEALEDKKAMDVRILDITHVSTLADYFMIAAEATVTRCRQWQTTWRRYSERPAYIQNRSKAIRPQTGF